MKGRSTDSVESERMQESASSADVDLRSKKGIKPKICFAARLPKQPDYPCCSITASLTEAA